MCAVLPSELEKLPFSAGFGAGRSLWVEWLMGPCSGEQTSALCEMGDAYRAGGTGWQVLERRESHGKVRAKITSGSEAGVTRLKKKEKIQDTRFH